MAKMLDKIGFKNYEMAHDGEQAYNMFIKNRYDIVLMDVSMPKIDGLGETKLIRNFENEQGQTPVPIIAVTANATEKQSEKCIEAGMTHFLAKPVILSALKTKLETIIVPKGKSKGIGGSANL